MQSLLASIRDSVTAKVVFIGILILVLLIPVAMIRDVIHDRSRVSEAAQYDVMRSWGAEQLVAAPYLVLPYTVTLERHRGSHVDRIEQVYHACLLPARLDINVDIRPDTRYRGIHEVTVYSASLEMSGSFNKPELSDLPQGAESVRWDDAYVVFGVSDARAITRAPQLRIAGRAPGFAPSGNSIDGLPTQIVAATGDIFDEPVAPFDFELDINGTSQLQLLPLGDTTTVSMQSSWPSPSFTGNYLPETREVNEQGFAATWRVSSLGRSLPSIWQEGAVDNSLANQSAFGVQLFQPVGLYQLSLRASKYAVLFIGLSFVAYFLFEVIASLRLHPLQYLLVGFANALFYLLLLSLAEHLAFGLAYLLAAAASTVLIVAYSASVLGQRSRAGLMGLVLSLLYGFLYMTLKAETYAMLAGSTGLWATLGLIMYLTRKVDWYGRRD